MSSWSLTKAPTWAPDAIATDKGWVDPKNGDILVACKRLKNAVSYADTFGKGVCPRKGADRQRGGARPGAGRKSDSERAKIAKSKIDSGEKLSAGEANALKKVEGVDVDPKQVKKPVKRKPRKKATHKKED